MFDINQRKRGGTDEPELTSGSETTWTPEPPVSSTTRVREAAKIGPSIHIEGDLRGSEDLIIEGEVKGTIHLKENNLTIGSNGKIQATVYARSIVIEGSLHGDLYGAERVAIRKSGDVRGNIVSPRVSLDDGGKFKGSIEMDGHAVESAFSQVKGDRPSPVSSASGPRRDEPAKSKSESEPALSKGGSAA